MATAAGIKRLHMVHARLAATGRDVAIGGGTMKLTLYELYCLMSVLETSLHKNNKTDWTPDCESVDTTVRIRLREKLIEKMSGINIPVEIERYLLDLAKDGNVEELGRFTKAKKA